MRAETREAIAIEQAIARGDTASSIADQLGVDVEAVHVVWDRLDQIADTDEDDPYVPPTYSAALAAERIIVAGNAAYDRDSRSLLEQVVDAPRSPTCGTWAAYCRHQRKWEPVDPLCRLAARDYARHSRRIYRARTRQAAAA